MNADIWKFHDWLIDQKNEKKVNENDCDYILQYIRKTYTPNIDNIYVQENILIGIDSEMDKQYLANEKFWLHIFDESKELAPSILYKRLGELISYFEKIEMIESDLQNADISINRNAINSMFGSMIHATRTNIYFSYDYIVDDFLIIFFTNADHDNDEYMFFYDQSFNAYGLCNGYKSGEIFISNFKSGLINHDKLHNDKLNNVKLYLDYLNHLWDGYQSSFK